jgi:hypothetical protein
MVFDTEVSADITGVTSDRLPTGVEFFAPIRAVMELGDVPVQRGGTDVVDVRVAFGRPWLISGRSARFP